MARFGAGLARGLIAAGIAVGLSPSANAGSVRYVYDGAGRLVTATYTDGSSVQYSYDAAGNRTQQTVVCSSCGPPPIAGNVSADIGYNTTGTAVSFALSGGAPTSAAITTLSLVSCVGKNSGCKVGS